jgi:CubicO group peptidase (beta-lactamase class C family)
MTNPARVFLALPGLVLAPLLSGTPDWAFLPDLLEELRGELGAPSISVAVAAEGGVVARAALGVRALGGESPVTVDDRFHIGSITKPMTATLIGRLVERGELGWDAALGDLLPEVEMEEVYRSVTLDQLLMHRGGIQPYLTFDDAEDAILQALPGSPTEQRAAFLSDVLYREPVAPPGSAFVYSNAGYVLAAYAAEQATGKSWEALMDELVFDPLGMRASGVGWPATVERPEQPLGHMRAGGALEVQPIGGWEVGSFLAPAGDVHASAGDLARFGLLHARGLAGIDGLLSAATIEHLHAPPEGAAGMAYARGWFLSSDGHWHGGSAGSFYALLQLLPEHDAAVAVLVNSGDTASHAAATRIVARVSVELAKRD